jgi:hypothetical protein
MPAHAKARETRLLYFLQTLFIEEFLAILTCSRIVLTTTAILLATALPACNVMHITKKTESIVEVIESK